ncbi:SCO0607 family lipoprotein [Streptomyces sp. NPDC003860]
MPRRPSSPTAPSRPGTARTVAPRAVGAVLAGAFAVVALTGCSLLEFEEGICSGGAYPVLTVNGTGSACVSNGEEPPQGYARYPEGKVPKHVDDEWDVYWRTHTVDEDGTVIDAPDGT